MAALRATNRTQFDQPIAGSQQVGVMFDGQHSMSGIHQSIEHTDQPGNIFQVQTYGGFIQYIQRFLMGPFDQFLGDL
jgi:hypothetical protein